MAYETPPHGRPKTRSASICAPASGSLETILNPPSGSGTPDNGTPGYQRRRPATRTQSARITGARSVRRKVQAQQQNLQESTRSHCTSEPRLNDTETPPQRRRGSQRRPTHSQSQRKTNTFLDVPTSNYNHVSDNEDDIDRLRTFSSSKGGVINRGDSFRRRRSRSNSLAPTSPMSYQAPAEVATRNGPVDSYRVFMLGAPEVGKNALISQFQTSECINAYEGPETSGEENISIILNGEESELKFVTDRRGSKEELEKCDAFVIVYSVVDKASFTHAEQLMVSFQDMDLIRTRPVILVANKIDLARSRAVSSQDGRCLACTFRAKFIEVSVGINHNVDELLAGTLTQIRLKKENNILQGSRENSPAHWYKSRGVVRASMKARQMITWILGKEDSKFKNCENLQVL
ncbi:GTP-binding protein RAD [Bradysia coprophila]|uniref:GTP-binding protein RAD n=1 Tax=Bradysia coprophila TaxID=38358 RepID=UPI00187DB987|nr:GTP-binding protein RAD [Bradysia coprophila]XP_037035630.1 GTP-binding protein RAD [Bradysia coprophila]